MQNSILEWVVYLFYFCFMNNKCAIYKFWIFEFWIYFIFKYSDIGLLWSKITIFMIGITLKLILHIKYGWNNPEAGWVWKVQNFIFFAISGSKIHCIHKHSNTCHGLNFHRNLIVFKCSKQCPLSQSITIEITKKLLITAVRSP